MRGISTLWPRSGALCEVAMTNESENEDLKAYEMANVDAGTHLEGAATVLIDSGRVETGWFVRGVADSLLGTQDHEVEFQASDEDYGRHYRAGYDAAEIWDGHGPDRLIGFALLGSKGVA